MTMEINTTKDKRMSSETIRKGNKIRLLDASGQKTEIRIFLTLQRIEQLLIQIDKNTRTVKPTSL